MHKPKLIPDWNDTRSSETSVSEDIMKTEIQAYGTWEQLTALKTILGSVSSCKTDTAD